MRVPVRMAIQQVDVGPFVGPRRAVVLVDPEQVLEAGRRARLFAYGGDVRTENPLSLVFHGNLGDDVAPAVDTTVYEPSGLPPAYPDILTEQMRTVSPVYAPVYTPTPSVATPPYVPSPTSGDTTPWWQVLPAITGSAAVVAQAIQRIVSPGAAPAAGVTQYTIPATATSPAQRVTYNPATGQITTTPITAGVAAGLPSFLRAEPGAPWYQNPMLLIGGGLVALILVIAVARR